MSAKTVADLEEIEGAIQLWRDVLGDGTVGRKYNEGEYERRFNRAVLDAQVFAALDKQVAANLRSDPTRGRSILEGLMTSDRQFRASVEATTKSLDAVHYRMDALRKALL
jgi:hypothetical protein